MEKTTHGFDSPEDLARMLLETQVQKVEIVENNAKTTFIVLKYVLDESWQATLREQWGNLPNNVESPFDLFIGFIVVPEKEFAEFLTSYGFSAEESSDADQVAPITKQFPTDHPENLMAFWQSASATAHPRFLFPSESGSSLNMKGKLRAAEIVCFAHDWPKPEVFDPVRNVRLYFASAEDGQLQGWAQSLVWQNSRAIPLDLTPLRKPVAHTNN